MYKFFKLLEDDEKKKLSLIVFFIVILGVAESETFFLLQPIFNHFNTGQFDVQIPVLKFFFKYLNLDIFFLLGVFIFFFSVRFFLSILV